MWRPGEAQGTCYEATFREVVNASGNKAGVTFLTMCKSRLPTRTYKSTTDLCLVTMYESESTKEVSEGNRELQGELDAKLARFKDYRSSRVRRFRRTSPRRNCSPAKAGWTRNTSCKPPSIAIKTGSRPKLLNVEVGQNFWSKTVREGDMVGEGIAAHVAGHDAIHRESEKFTPMELLQLGKSLWEDSTS